MFGDLAIRHLDPYRRTPRIEGSNTLARSIPPGGECKVPYERGVQLTVDWFRGQIAKDRELIALT